MIKIGERLICADTCRFNQDCAGQMALQNQSCHKNIIEAGSAVVDHWSVGPRTDQPPEYVETEASTADVGMRVRFSKGKRVK